MVIIKTFDCDGWMTYEHTEDKSFEEVSTELDASMEKHPRVSNCWFNETGFVEIEEALDPATMRDIAECEERAADIPW